MRVEALEEVAFLAVGAGSLAWTASSAVVDRRGRRPPQVIVLGPATTVAVTLHELAHAWHAGWARAHAPALTARGERGLVAYAERVGWRPREHIDRGERFATACALVWAAEEPP